jgi:hypothetical protein
LVPFVALTTACVETIHHGKSEASKMGASAKLEVPIPRGKNGCANLNEKMGIEAGSAVVIGRWVIRGGQFTAHYQDNPRETASGLFASGNIHS